jgi:hypothetical protein
MFQLGASRRRRYRSSYARKRAVLAPAAVLLAAIVFLPASPASAETHAETTGGVTHTWTNYTNAGGYEGPTIPAYSTVQITCALHGFPVANGNDWWYQIASDPWNNQYYASADAFYNNGDTSGSLVGTPYVDPSVPICGSTPPPTTPPPTSPPPSNPPPGLNPSIYLNQGQAAAEGGYWYAISLSGFGSGNSVSVSCRDSVDPGGFRTFSIIVNGSGSAATSSQCRSGDGPDHWVVAGGHESNHVRWGSGGNPPPPATPPTSTPPPQTTGRSVFYSGLDDSTAGASPPPADQNLGCSQWRSSTHCGTDRAVNVVDFGKGRISTLAGWSKGRLGVIYYLQEAGTQRVRDVHRIVLFDPGDLADMNRDRIKDLIGQGPCDWKFDTNGLIANWLASDESNRLIIFAGEKTEHYEGNEPRYRGIWKYYLAGLWNKPFADRSKICHYEHMDHEAIVPKFGYMVGSMSFDCPPGGSPAWHP